MPQNGGRPRAMTESEDAFPLFDRAWATPTETNDEPQSEVDQAWFASTSSARDSTTAGLPRQTSNVVSKKSAFLKGSCACGKIRYISSSLPSSAANCHCRACRKIAGGPYLTWAETSIAGLTWSQPPAVFEISKVAKRGFCRSCGSNLTMYYYCVPEQISIAVGTIDDGIKIPKPAEHIFLKEKATWYDLPDDGLARFDMLPPPFQAKLDAWRAHGGDD